VRLDPHHRLTDDALYLLQEWFAYYLTGAPSDFVLKYQAQQMERLSQAQRGAEGQPP
jgi:hypothetical protein